MLPGTNDRGRISGNLLCALMTSLRGGPFHVMGFGGGIATPGGKVRYPAAIVTTAPIPGHERLIPEPMLVFDIIGPGTSGIDHVHKLREYHAVPSIRRYVLIEQDGIALTVHSRQHDEPWTTIPLLDGDTLALPELGIELPIAPLYDGITVQDPPAS